MPRQRAAQTYFNNLLTDRADVTFVTTNYDVHIELAALQCNRAVRIPGDSLQLRGKGRVPEIDIQLGQHNADRAVVRLFKLHGSVNWEVHEGGVFVDSGVRVVERGPPPHATPLRLQFDQFGDDTTRERTASHCRSVKRLLVAPEVLKTSQIENAVIQEQWRGAAEAIANAHMLWFIGYSFPDTDSFMRFFLGASLFQNARLRQIAVVDPNYETIRTRAMPAFAAPRLREVLRTIPLRIEHVNIDALFRDAMDEVLHSHNLARIQSADAVRAVTSGHRT